MNINPIMISTNIVVIVSTTIIARRRRVRSKGEPEIAGRVIEGHCRAAGDAWACVVLDLDVWLVVFN